MIRLLTIIFLLLLSIDAAAQKNSVKASALFFPFPILYTISTGYERVFAEKYSVQLSYNFYGYDFDNRHGPRANFRSMIGEGRYYFGPQESFRSQFFTGVFVEVGKLYEYGNGDDYMVDSYFDGAEGRMVNPGLFLGKNLRFGGRLHLEVLIAWKYKFISKTETYIDNGVADYRQVYEEDPDFQMRLNLAYSF